MRTPKTRGRPRQFDPTPLPMRITAEMKNALCIVSGELGVSVADYIRGSVEKSLRRDAKRLGVSL